METKICKSCGIEKEITEFYYRKENNAYRTECKKCMLDKQKLKRSKKEKKKKERIIPESKICTKCKIDKPISEYRIMKSGYVNSVCLSCEYRQNMERYYKKKNEDPEFLKNRNKRERERYYEKNKDSKFIEIRNKREREMYYEKRMTDPKYAEWKQIKEKNELLINKNKKICIICKKEKDLEEFYYRKDLKKYRNWCIECEKNRTKDFYENNKVDILDKQHQSYKENRDVILARKKDYANRHKEQLKEYHTKYVYNRRKNDDLFHFKSQIRHLINQSFRRRGIQKRGKTEEIVGCDFETFNNYLLETYKKNYGVEWDGKEKVHIDHIVPLTTASTEEEIIKLCHYTNLQLLKAKDNLEKKDRLDWNLKEELK